MEKSLLYVTYWHPSGGGTAVGRTTRLAKYLGAAGWSVVVLCGTGGAAASPDGAVSFRILTARGPFSGGAPGADPKTTQPPPARFSAPRPPSRIRVLMREILFFPDPQLYWVPFAFATALRYLRGRAVSAIYCSGPPFSAFLLGRALAALWKVPLVLDYRDVWLDHPWWPLPAWRRRADAWLERRLLARASLIIANHEPMRTLFLGRNPQIADRCFVLPNGFDAEELGPPVRPRWSAGERFEIVYCGTIYGPVRGRDSESESLSVQRPKGLLEALRQLSDRGVFGPGGVHASFVGAKPSTGEAEQLMACARECGVETLVDVLPRMEKRAAVPIMRRAHLLVNMLYYTEAQVAQKVYDYMHLEIPVLSLFRETEANAELTRQARLGPIVDPADRDGIAAAIQGIIQAYSKGVCPVGSNRPFIDQFDVRRQGEVLTRRLETATRTSPSTRNGR